MLAVKLSRVHCTHEKNRKSHHYQWHLIQKPLHLQNHQYCRWPLSPDLWTQRFPAIWQKVQEHPGHNQQAPQQFFFFLLTPFCLPMLTWASQTQNPIWLNTAAHMHFIKLHQTLWNITHAASLAIIYSLQPIFSVFIVLLYIFIVLHSSYTLMYLYIM